jgi:hypothetical protein
MADDLQARIAELEAEKAALRVDAERRLVRRLEALGNTVSLTPKDPAA